MFNLRRQGAATKYKQELQFKNDSHSTYKVTPWRWKGSFFTAAGHLGCSRERGWDYITGCPAGWRGPEQARGARELIPGLLRFLRCPLTPNRVNQNKTRAVLPTSSVNPFPKLASTSVHLICPNPQSDTPIPALELDLHTQSLWENARASLILLLLSLPPGLYCLSICSHLPYQHMSFVCLVH